MITVPTLEFLKESLSKLAMPVDSVPGWVTFCGNTAPFAAIIVFLAVSHETSMVDVLSVSSMCSQ